MTLPDDLIQAVAEGSRVWLLEEDFCEDDIDLYAESYAQIAVAAVLRALPESDKAITAGGYALMQVEGADHPDLDYSLSVRKGEARIVLAAIAKLADDE